MNLKEFARARGTNLKRVAEECGVPSSTLYAISSGETNFDNVGIGLFIKLANALDVNTDDLYRLDFDSCELAEKAIRNSKENDPVEEFISSMPLSADEQELLNCYRQVEPWEQELILSHARMVVLHAHGKAQS